MSAAWLLLGIGMGLGLCDAAFGALCRIYGDNARKAITGITLIAAFASTVGWPLSSLGLDTIVWRGTCYAWVAAHILIGLPLNIFFLPKTAPAQYAAGPVVKPHIQIDRTMVLLSFAFAAAWTVTSAMAAHLPRIVEAFGAAPAQAVVAGMMIGPAQVAARVIEASALSRFHRLARLRHASDRRRHWYLPRRRSPCCTAPATASSPLRAERCRSQSSACLLNRWARSGGGLVSLEFGRVGGIASAITRGSPIRWSRVAGRGGGAPCEEQRTGPWVHCDRAAGILAAPEEFAGMIKRQSSR
jgi:hypothetical protein